MKLFWERMPPHKQFTLKSLAFATTVKTEQHSYRNNCKTKATITKDSNLLRKKPDSRKQYA